MTDQEQSFEFEKHIGDPPPSDHSEIWGEYTCGGCGAKGVRLWRDYQTFLDHQTLRCRGCAMAHEGKGEDWEPSGDQIGWSVPAVPTSDGSTFWGYTSVPMAAVDWWRALPERSWTTEPEAMLTVLRAAASSGTEVEAKWSQGEREGEITSTVRTASDNCFRLQYRGDEWMVRVAGDLVSTRRDGLPALTSVRPAALPNP